MSAVDEIVKSLGEKKFSFLNTVETSINTYISNKSWQDCLTIVLRYSNGNISSTWYPSEVMEGYTPRFIAFLRKKSYNGYTVDSVLTDGVVDLVTSKFSSFYKNNSDCISKPLLEQLLGDHVFVEQLSKQVVEISNGTLPSVIKSQMASFIIHNLESSINVNITHMIATSTTQIMAAAATLPISKAMVAVMAKSMGVFMKAAIAKVLASTAMKTMMMTAVKKIVAAKIIAGLLALVGTHLGGMSVAWVVAPLLAAFIAYEVAHLPEKMGKKVSEAVVAELSGEFEKINKNVVQQILASFSTSVISSLATDIANDEEVKELLRNMVQK